MKKRLGLFGALALTIGLVTGCGNASPDENADAEGTYSGMITAAGSTALQPLAEEAAEEFMNKHTGLSITVQGGGSGTGVNQVASGAVDIGNSDIPSALKVEDREDLVDSRVAGLIFGVVVNEDAGVDSLTKEQIQDVFSGEVTNWNEVGGNDLDIQVINRPASSGTRVTFVNTVMEDVAINDAIGIIQESNGAVAQAINSTPGAVSYLAKSFLIGDNADTLTTVAINGVEGTIENVAAGDYPFWAYQYMITQGEPAGEVLAFINFVRSEEFASTVEAMGYVPMTELPEE